jgi:hypothetical protein
VSLVGQWRYSLQTDKLTVTLRLARRVYSLARELHDTHGLAGALQFATVLGHLERNLTQAEALHLAHRTSEALEAVSEAAALAQRLEVHECVAELHRLRGMFLAALGADEAQIEAAFREAICIARQQKSIALAARAEASHAEYRGRKAEGPGNIARGNVGGPKV